MNNKFIKQKTLNFKMCKPFNTNVSMFTSLSIFTQAALSFGLLFLGAKIVIPFYPLPFTLQTFTISINALMFSSRANYMGLGLYILVGLVGFPVFTAGAGLNYIIGASFGYIIGFGLSTYIQNSKIISKNIILNQILGTAALHLAGSSWLLALGFENVLNLTLQYYLGELVKLAVFASFSYLYFNKSYFNMENKK